MGTIESSITRRGAYWTQEELCNELGRLSGKLGESEAINETAKEICKEAFEKGLSRGRTMRSFIAATLFVALRKKQKPLSFRDFVAKIGVEEKKVPEIAKYYRTLVEELDIKIPVVDPTLFLPRIASQVHASEGTIEQALIFLKDAKEITPETTCRDPMAVASASIYICSLRQGESITQKELAIAAGVTEECVRIMVQALRRVQPRFKMVY